MVLNIALALSTLPPFPVKIVNINMIQELSVEYLIKTDVLMPITDYCQSMFEQTNIVCILKRK